MRQFVSPWDWRRPRRTPRGAGPAGKVSLTQQQQLELAARVLLVPAKLPLDLCADALRLLLLGRQAAAAGHGARRATHGRRGPSAPTREPRQEGADASFGGTGLGLGGSIPPRGRAGSEAGRVRTTGTDQVTGTRAQAARAPRGATPAPEDARPLARGPDAQSEGADRT